MPINSPLQQAQQRISELEKQLAKQQQQERLRHRIMTGPATLSGQDYFDRMALELAEILSADFTLIGEIADNKFSRIKTLALCADQQLQKNIEYNLAGTPCAEVLDQRICCHPAQVTAKFPADQLLVDLGIEGYVGVPLYDATHQPIGIIAALFRQPVAEPRLAETTLQLFANLTAAEILRQQELSQRDRLEQDYQAINARLREKGAELNHSLQTLDAIIETLPSPIFFKNKSGVYTGCNRAFCDYLGKTRQQIINHTVDDIAPSELARVYHRADLKLMQQHGTQSYQAQVRHADGSHRDILFCKATIGDADAEVIGLVGIMTDVTELNETKQFMTEIINTLPDPVFVKDEQHRWQILNKACCTFFGHSQSELLGKSDYDFFPKEQADIFWSKDQEVFDSGIENVNEEQLTNSRNEIVHLETKKTVFRKASGEKYLVGIIRDITNVRSAEHEMLKLKKLLRNIINSMPSALITIDSQGRVNHCNRQAETLAGLRAEEAIGQDIHALFPLLSSERDLVEQALVSRKPQKTTKTFFDLQGGKQFFDVLIYPLITEEMTGAVIRIDNASERVRMEELLVQSEKMLSLGGLAAGMAHEINNPLAGILQNLYVIKSRLLSDSPANSKLAEELGIDLIKLRQFLQQRKIPALLEMISESGQRAAKTVLNMLSFSRNDAPEMRPCDLKQVIEETLELAKKDLTGGYDFRSFRIIKELPELLPKVPGVKSQLQQVMLNLLRNAAQAISSWCELSAEPEIRVSVSSDSHQVTIHIADNGPGINEDLRKRIFEPFFSTKEVSSGTGLGLSVSYYIITNTHKGTLRVDSIPGQGACFHISLPIARQQPTANL